MRYAIAFAGLAVAAQAGQTRTITATEEVTVTSCSPAQTDCAYNNWENWGPADPTSSSTWGTWDPAYTSTTTSKKPADDTAVWNAWDPAYTSTTSKKPADDTATWSAWDPAKTTTTSKKPSDNTATWGAWDPSKPSTTSKKPADETTWGTWSYAKPTTTSKKPSYDDNTWGNWEEGNKVSKTSSKPASPTNNGEWNNWGYADGSKTSGKPATATGYNGEWNNWSSKTSGKPATATGYNGEWNNWGSTITKTQTATVSCPQYTATTPPAWFAQLPSAVLSSLAAQWTGAPPSDWCYYSYSAPAFATKTPDAAAGTPTWSGWNDATATGVKGASQTSSAPVAKYTGAANANAASFVLGGAAAIAAVILV